MVLTVAAPYPGPDDLEILVSDASCDALHLPMRKAAPGSRGALRFFLSVAKDPAGEPAAARFGLRDPADGRVLAPPRRIGADGELAFDLPEPVLFELRLDFPRETRIERFGLLLDTGAETAPVSFGEGLLLLRDGSRTGFDAAKALPADSAARAALLARPGHSPRTKAWVARDLLTAEDQAAPRDAAGYAALLSHVVFARMLSNGNWLETRKLQEHRGFLCSPARIEMFMREINRREAERAARDGRDPAAFVISKHAINPSWLVARAPQYLRALEAVMDASGALGVPCCLAYGTLLGALRNQGFIPHDDDVDVIVDLRATSQEAMETGLSELAAGLGAKGIRARRAGSDPHYLQAFTPFGPVDIYAFWVRDGRANLPLVGNRVEDIDATILTGGEPGRATLHGTSFPAPPKPHAFLRACYGPDWQVPDVYHDWPWPLRSAAPAGA